MKKEQVSKGDRMKKEQVSKGDRKKRKAGFKRIKRNRVYLDE